MIVKQIFQASRILAVGTIVNIIMLFIFNALLVRVLLKNDVANFFLTLSLINFFAIIITFGSQNIALKRFSDIFSQNIKGSAKELLNGFIKTNLLVTIITTFVLIALYLMNILKFFNLDYVPFHIIIISIWFWSLGFQAVLSSIFSASGQFLLAILSSGVVVNFVNLMIIILPLAMQIQLGFDLLLIAIAINTSVVTLVSLYFANNYCQKFDKSAKINNQNKSYFGLTREIISQSIPSLINKLGLYFTIVADIWLISLFFSKSTVAEYGIAAKLAALLSLFLIIANGFIPTFIGRLKKNGKEQVEVFVRVIATIVALPTFILCGILYFYSEEVIQLIFGLDYIQSVSFFSVLLLGQLVNVAVGSSSYILVMEGKNRQLMNISLLTGIMAISLSLVSMNFYDKSILIAWSFTLAAMTRHILVYRCARRLSGINSAVYLNPFLFIKSCKKLNSQ